MIGSWEFERQLTGADPRAPAERCGDPACVPDSKSLRQRLGSGLSGCRSSTGWTMAVDTPSADSGSPAALAVGHRLDAHAPPRSRRDWCLGGGLEALTAIMQVLPASLKACVMIVMHTRADTNGVLPEILARGSARGVAPS